MPPIPVHIDDPITPQKPQGITPQTTAALAPTAAINVTTTTSAPYPPARPGQAAAPAPTPYLPRAQPEATRTSQQALLGENRPPPPQPGAVPVPPSQHAPTPATSSLPPPPKAGDLAAPAGGPQASGFTSALHQMHVPPPPQMNYAPTRSTATATGPVTPFRSAPTTLNLGPVASAPGSAASIGAVGSGPPGYQQNVYAQEMSPAQRASLDMETRRESIAAQLGLTGGENSGGGHGGFGGSGSEGTAGEMWGKAKGWLNSAGTKLAETEEQVWRSINGNGSL
ncbi:hypothetical protein LTR08_005272 [Meristemomyces frigidus]|nr:hypothetical protein LTR08_005272 [Meristemomyces frigidus]